MHPFWRLSTLILVCCLLASLSIADEGDTITERNPVAVDTDAGEKPSIMDRIASEEQVESSVDDDGTAEDASQSRNVEAAIGDTINQESYNDDDDDDDDIGDDDDIDVDAMDEEEYQAYLREFDEEEYDEDDDERDYYYSDAQDDYDDGVPLDDEDTLGDDSDEEDYAPEMVDIDVEASTQYQDEEIVGGTPPIPDTYDDAAPDEGEEEEEEELDDDDDDDDATEYVMDDDDDYDDYQKDNMEYEEGDMEEEHGEEGELEEETMEYEGDDMEEEQESYDEDDDKEHGSTIEERLNILEQEGGPPPLPPTDDTDTLEEDAQEEEEEAEEEAEEEEPEPNEIEQEVEEKEEEEPKEEQDNVLDQEISDDGETEEMDSSAEYEHEYNTYYSAQEMAENPTDEQAKIDAIHAEIESSPDEDQTLDQDEDQSQDEDENEDDESSTVDSELEPDLLPPPVLNPQSEDIAIVAPIDDESVSPPHRPQNRNKGKVGKESNRALQHCLDNMKGLQEDMRRMETEWDEHCDVAPPKIVLSEAFAPVTQSVSNVMTNGLNEQQWKTLILGLWFIVDVVLCTWICPNGRLGSFVWTFGWCTLSFWSLTTFKLTLCVVCAINAVVPFAFARKIK